MSAIAYVLRYKAAEALHRVGDTPLKGRNDFT